MFLTIDTGTTNTKIYLTDGKTVTDCIKISAGAGDTAKTGSNRYLKDSIRNGILELLGANKLSEHNIEAIYASGMITSELGLHEVPHITAPVTQSDLRNHAKTVLMEDVSCVPITFIPGVKNKGHFQNISNLNDIDMMRGEETELFGLLSLSNCMPPLTVILPGSHTKFVTVGSRGEILSCHTTLGGEILAAVSENTILSSSLPHPLVSEISPEYLTAGFLYCRKHGVSSAAFRVRLLHKFADATENERANFFAGSMLAPDIQALEKAAPETKILVGGSEPLKSIFVHLAKIGTSREVFAAKDEAVCSATVCGVMEIFCLKE